MNKTTKLIAMNSEHQKILLRIARDSNSQALENPRAKVPDLGNIPAELLDKKLFWSHLKLKTGLPADYWSDTLRVFRYTAECFTV